MKTLVVSYLPSGKLSKTKRLLDTFLAETKDFDVEHIDLIKDDPDVFDSEKMTAYLERDYMGKELTGPQKKAMANMDRMTEQFLRADIVVLATPMHNFSLPAPVKAYFDSILLKGKTWDFKDNKYVGLMKGKKALILMASGGVYEGPNSWDHAMSLAKVEFTFMGFSEIESAWAAGVNKYPDKVDEIVEKAKQKVKEVVKRWYN